MFAVDGETPTRSQRTSEREAVSLAESRLRDSSYHDVRRIWCTLNDGILVLHGRVASFYYKQIAQTVIGKIDGVVSVTNCVEVDDSFAPRRLPAS